MKKERKEANCQEKEVGVEKANTENGATYSCQPKELQVDIYYAPTLRQNTEY
jgi:hypothetical protein